MLEASPLALTRLTSEHQAAYLDMVDEFEAAGEGYPYNNIPLARSDWEAYVRELDDEERGIGQPPGISPQTTYVLLREDIILGEIRFRPQAMPGRDHIGYNVRPSQRRRGYATWMLGRVLDEARALGLPGVSLAVGDDNPGSVRTIAKYGGVPAQRSVDAQGWNVTTYWIAL